MIVFPNAKINLGLQVLRRRPDGYHDLETIFYPIPLSDILEAVIVKNETEMSEIQNRQIITHYSNDYSVKFSSSGFDIPGETAKNLCLKACSLFDDEVGLPGNLLVHLHKLIPMGAGLGGGSSDGAFMLKLLNSLSETPLTDSRLYELALELGSDCPFFISNLCSYASGRGELLEPLHIDLAGKQITVVFPNVHVPTASAFSGVKLNAHPVDLKQLPSKSQEEWSEFLRNDFEESIFIKHPEIRQAKEELINAGAWYASMTGSGSAVFGIFENPVVEVSARLSFPSYTALLC